MCVLCPNDGEFDDTDCECDGREQNPFRYAHNQYPPHFPVPAIPVKVGWQPEHPMQLYPSAYWYICSRDLLWSIFQRWGLVIERI